MMEYYVKIKASNTPLISRIVVCTKIDLYEQQVEERQTKVKWIEEPDTLEEQLLNVDYD